MCRTVISRMVADVSTRVREIARYRETEESHIIQQAVEKGLEGLWRDVVITQYLEGDMTREEAVDELGRDVIRDVDKAAQYVEEDVTWGLSS